MKKLFEKLKGLNLFEGKYAVFGSGHLGIRGLRESRDLDIIVYQDIYDQYKQNPDWKEKECNGTTYLSWNDELELWKDWGPGKWDIKELIKSAETINDIPFVRLEEVLKWKKNFRREKDLKDVEIIENLIRSS